MNTKVSVIIVTINRGEYIGDTLEALKFQSYDNFEVIVVDGGSTDNTLDIVAKYPARVFASKKNI